MLRCVTAVILGSFLSLGARAAATPPTEPAELVRALNAATARAQYVSALQALGFTEEELKDVENKTSGKLSEVSIFKKDYFLRAEAFAQDLEGPPGKETVVQVVFHVVDYDAAWPDAGAKVYFVAVLDSKERGYVPLARKIFDLTLCGPGERKDEKWENAMSFGFKPLPKKKFKQVVFKVTEVDACAMQIETTHHQDTLAFDGKKFVFTKGGDTAGDKVNRMDPAVIK
jgi:hypothetical protein